MADIIYDIDKLKAAKKSISSLKTELDTCNTNLDKNLTSLKNAWNTDAGKKFFKDHKNTWSTYVKKYVKKLNGLEKMIDAVIKQYENINDSVDKINI